MLKITRLFKLAQIFETNNNKIIRVVDKNKINKTVQNLFNSQKLKNTKFKIQTYISAIEKLMFINSQEFIQVSKIEKY